jgi:hypothetical protein
MSLLLTALLESLNMFRHPQPASFFKGMEYKACGGWNDNHLSGVDFD